MILILTCHMIKKVMGNEKHKTQAALKCRRHNVSNLKAR